MNHQAGLEYERSFWDQGKHVVGIDEAGRGPIAGPLVVAGAVFDIGYANSEIYDSKALSEKKREKLFSLILREARCYKIKIVTPEKFYLFRDGIHFSTMKNTRSTIRKKFPDCGKQTGKG